MPTSYYLEDGQTIIFAWRRWDSNYWKIGYRNRRGKTDNIASFPELKKKYFYSEEECKVALHEYARQHNLKPAY
jgi:hypothetical protein